MDMEIVLRKIKNNPKKYGGILLVHTFGVEESFETCFKEIKSINDQIIIIDDKCLCFPSFTDRQDSYADMIIFSTGYGKIIDIGFGGYAYINDNLNFRNHKSDFDYICLEKLTNNYKKCINNNKKFEYKDSNWLDNSKANISFCEYKEIIKKNINEVTKLKQNINIIYKENLPEEIQLNEKFQLWRFNVLVPQKDKLIGEIFSNRLFVSSHYDSLDGIFGKGNSVHAKNMSHRIINLFNDKYFNEKKANLLVKIINNHLEKCT